MSQPVDNWRTSKKNEKNSSTFSDTDILQYENSDTTSQRVEEPAESSSSYGSTSTATLQPTSAFEVESETNLLEPGSKAQKSCNICGNFISSTEACQLCGYSVPSSIQNALQPNAETEKMQLKLLSLDELGYDKTDKLIWCPTVPQPKANLWKMLEYMIKNGIKPNVRVNIDDMIFNCHMLVLQVYSKFFTDYEKAISVDLPINKVKPTAFIKIYDWMVNQVSIINCENILEIFMAADFLRIKLLIKQCWMFLNNTDIFCEDTAFLLYVEARCYDVEILEQLMLARVCRFFLVLVASKAFLHLNVIELCKILGSNRIGVNTEVEVLMAAARWLDYDWQARENHLLQVAKHVRYSLLPPAFLVLFTRKTVYPEVDRIMNHPEVKHMITDAISYTTTKLYFNNRHSEFAQLLDKYQLKTPINRQWIFDRRCAYHHLKDCTGMKQLTYDLFTDYLDTLRVDGRRSWCLFEVTKTLPTNFKCCKKYGEPRHNALLN